MNHPRSFLRRAVGTAAALVVASAALFSAGSSFARAEVRRHRRLQAVERQDRRGLPGLGGACQPVQDGGRRRSENPIGNLSREHRDHPHRGCLHRQPRRHRHPLGYPRFPSEDNRVTIGGDARTATFTIADQATLPVLLTNNATRTTGEPPAPPAPGPGNPGPTNPADPVDPGAFADSEPIDASESAKAPRTEPTPMRPGLPRTGREG